MSAKPGDPIYFLCTLIILHSVCWPLQVVSSIDTTTETLATTLATSQQEEEPPATITIETHNNEPTPTTRAPIEEARDEGQPERPPATSSPLATETTTTSLGEVSTVATTTEHQQQQQPVECGPEIYCFHGGTCIINDRGAKECICPPEYSGLRCQDRNICETLIADSLTGVQICAKINSACIKDDKIFRCACQADESFIFKLNHNPPKPNNKQTSHHRSAGQTSDRFTDQILRPSSLDFISPTSNRFTYDDHDDQRREGDDLGNSRFHHDPRVSGDSSNIEHHSDPAKQQQKSEQTYLAECRKIDKCLGVRCRQMSEVCQDGECQCNLNLGYMRDPSDNVCKLINPCELPTPEGQAPICGEARCVATLDSELYRCSCPLGYDAISSQGPRNYTKCVLMYDSVCRIPLLNKCQHICRIDESQNTYRCSCLPGYKSGTRLGIDEHMCFFNERFENLHDSYQDSSADHSLEVADTFDSLYPRYPPNQLALSPLSDQYEFRVFPKHTIDRRAVDSIREANNREATIPYDDDGDDDNQYRDHDSSREDSNRGETTTNSNLFATETQKKRVVRRISHTKDDGYEIRRVLKLKREPSNEVNGRQMDEELDNAGLSGMSAQDRCNMYCEENKICVLESGSTDSYKCICDRQGYVSVGDRCLDWCTAAVFQDNLIHGLNLVCYSGACIRSSLGPGTSKEAKQSPEVERLERQSSWRPQFECNCSTSPLLYQDPETKLCKLDFKAIVNPCLPGNEGYVDCVENKNAYCAVQHEHPDVFHSSLRAPRMSPEGVGPSGGQGGVSGSLGNTMTGAGGAGGASGPTSKSKIKSMLDKKSYACVCSLEKKFLVDQPRQKAICVDECDLLNNECGRFNRMCRAATIDIDDYGKRNLVQLYKDGPRMNFKRTGCECLPGFNVGPTELVYVTLDDNNRLGADRGPIQTIGGNGGYTLPPAPPTASDASDFDDEGASGVKYININSRCLLDYDVVEFNATFKAPADFDPRWVKIRNTAIESKLRLKATSGGADSSVSSNKNPEAKSTGNQSAAAATTTTTTSGKLGRSASVKESARQEENKVIKSDPLLEEARVEEKQQDQANKRTNYIIQTPSYMMADISELHKNVAFVAYCDPFFATISLEAYQECVMYRYWIVRKLRNHFSDWRQVMTAHLNKTFELMDGNIRFRVNKCEATIKSITGSSPLGSNNVTKSPSSANELITFDPMDPYTTLDADLDCELTVHAARDASKPHYLRQVMLERQLPKFVYTSHHEGRRDHDFGRDYYLMAPEILLKRETYDNFSYHHGEFRPCERDYAYCDKETKCTMKDQVNFTCTCLYGYTPIGSRDLFLGDSRKEVCEDIDECLFDVCKKLENVSTCVNEIGDYKCLCLRHYMGDNKEFCDHVCNIIPCKHGKCRLVADHYAFCECDEGYKESDCSVQDPSSALRKANMIICGSIFTSALLLAITWAISLNSQLKKTKKKLKRLEAANDAANLFDLSHHHNHQPYRPRMSKASVCS